MFESSNFIYLCSSVNHYQNPSCQHYYDFKIFQNININFAFLWICFYQGSNSAQNFHLSKFCLPQSFINIKNQSFSLVEFEIFTDHDLTIGISQNDEKTYPLNSGYEYSDVRIAIWELINGDLNGNTKYVKGYTSIAIRDTYLDFK